MTEEGGDSLEPPSPAGAGTPAEFVAELRALRTWSGLTYRQLEGKAAAHRDALPASTTATTLGRPTLPKARFVDAFTRACGLGEEAVREWLDARHRIATIEPAQPAGDENGEPPPPRRRWAGLVAAAVVGAAAALGGVALFSSAPGTPAVELGIPTVGTWALIHPAGTPGMCVTEGFVERYEHAIAARELCSARPQPHVYVEPIGEDGVQIQWHHSEHGVGCLTLMTDGPGEGLFEPRQECLDDNEAQLFRLEQLGPAGKQVRVRIRVELTGLCLGLRGRDTGTEVRQAPCADTRDQEFLIEKTNPW